MKKSIIMIICAIIAMSMLTGCQSKNQMEIMQCENCEICYLSDDEALKGLLLAKEGIMPEMVYVSYICENCAEK